jgi:1-acyl-sn-glycerol-3-phosphate acyltransferase
MSDISWKVMRQASAIAAGRKLHLTVEGLENLPPRGPALIAARHVHHLYDGVALVSTIDRPISIIVGLDWISSAPLRKAMQALCRSAQWPIINRSQPSRPVDPNESRRLLRIATAETMQLLRMGRPVVFFPEAYPNVDPGQTPKTGLDDFLPFEPGVVRIATMAARDGISAPIVPIGFTYKQDKKWAVTMRIGKPMVVSARQNEQALLSLLEMEVRKLSQAAAD